MTEWLHFHFSLSCIGEGNGNPLQCSCLEKPRDGEAWWAAVYGVAQSRTWLKRLSSSNSWFQNVNETKTIRGLSNNSIRDYCSYSCYYLYHFHLLLASDISTCSCRNVCPLLELLEPDLPPVTKKVIDLFTKPLKFLSALYPILALSAADTLTLQMVKDG